MASSGQTGVGLPFSPGMRNPVCAWPLTADGGNWRKIGARPRPLIPVSKASWACSPARTRCRCGLGVVSKTRRRMERATT